jgi:YegS/Rv2252/BmrU family lipid kinase
MPTDSPQPFWTIANPAAGGGRCGKQLDATLKSLEAEGHTFNVHLTRAAGDGVALAREGFAAGARRFLAVGGDGTSYEVVNGLFPEALASGERPVLASLPLGTGNSFLRDFGIDSAPKAVAALRAGQRRPVDVVRCDHADGQLFFINLLSTGFSATVGELTNRRFKPFGPAGYILAVVASLAKLQHPVLPLRADAGALDGRPATLLSFSNSRFTGGTMQMAPLADTGDGQLDIIRIGAISPLQLLRAFPKIFQGTHVRLPFVEQQRARAVEFSGEQPVDVMVDGEIRRLLLRRLEVLPAALEVIA